MNRQILRRVLRSWNCGMWRWSEEGREWRFFGEREGEEVENLNFEKEAELRDEIEGLKEKLSK